MNRVGSIVYSKDRAMQLDLLLHSYDKYFKNKGAMVVIFNYSNEEFKKGYTKITEKWGDQYNLLLLDENAPTVSGVKWTFKQLLIYSLTYLQANKLPYFLGLCDDDVFIKECDISDEMLYELESEEVNAISLKSGLNITHHYPNIVVPQPQNFIQTEPYLKWNWKTQPRPTDWGYPTCINSYVYNIDYYLSLLQKIEFNHPTVLEATCNTIRPFFRPIMVGMTQTCVLNIPCNRLQTVNDTPFGTEYAFTTKELNDKWLEGKIINTDNIYDKVFDRPNIDIPFTFTKE